MLFLAELYAVIQIGSGFYLGAGQGCLMVNKVQKEISVEKYQKNIVSRLNVKFNTHINNLYLGGEGFFGWDDGQYFKVKKSIVYGLMSNVGAYLSSSTIGYLVLGLEKQNLDQKKYTKNLVTGIGLRFLMNKNASFGFEHRMLWEKSQGICFRKKLSRIFRNYRTVIRFNYSFNI